MSDIKTDLDCFSIYASPPTSISFSPSSLLISLPKIPYSSNKPKPTQKLKTYKTLEKIIPLFALVTPPPDFSHSSHSSCFVSSVFYLYNTIDSDKLACQKTEKQPSTDPTSPKLYISAQLAMLEGLTKHVKIGDSRTSGDGSNSAVSDTEIWLVKGKSENQLLVPVTLAKFENEECIATEALVDSGYTGLCINQAFVNQYQLVTQKLLWPMRAYNTNSTLNNARVITKFV